MCVGRFWSIDMEPAVSISLARSRSVTRTISGPEASSTHF